MKRKVLVTVAVLLLAAAFWRYGYPQAKAQMIRLDVEPITARTIELLQFDQSNETTIDYFVDFMLRSSGLDKQWTAQLPVSEKQRFYNADEIYHYTAKIDEDREICVIAARFRHTGDHPYDTYRIAVCAHTSMQKKNDRLWLYVAGYPEIKLTDRDMFQMSQWFSGEEVHGNIFYDAAKDQPSDIMKKFELRYQDFGRDDVEQVVFYGACEVVSNKKQEMALPFVIYYQTEIDKPILNKQVRVEIPDLEQIPFRQALSPEKLLSYGIKDGWIGVGDIPRAVE